MNTYLLQLTTSDLGMQLRTEVIADSIKELKAKSIDMINKYKKVVCETYRIFSIKQTGNGFESTMLKQDIIRG